MERRLAEILEAVLKPLRFASKDEFRHLGTLKSLEPLVASLIKEALSLKNPPYVLARLEELTCILAGFDSLGESSKREKVLAALELIGSISKEGPVQALPVSPPLPPIDPAEAERRLKALKTPISFVKGIGPKLAERLAKKGLTTVEDLLYFLPLRYEDRSRLKRIRELTPGLSESTTGEVLAIGEARYGRRRVLEMAVGDGSDILKVKWFNFGPHIKKRFKNGQKLIIFGQVSIFGGRKEMVHPDIELADKDDEAGAAASASDGIGRIVPVYSQVENFHQKTIRKIVLSVVDDYGGKAVAGVPFGISERHGLMDLGPAMREAHLPSGTGTAILAKKSLSFDELFLLETGLSLRRASIKRERGISLRPDGRLEKGLRKILPFTLTGAQERTLSEIRKDMAAPHPMNRLIQGDVGSGKTVVSLIASLMTAECGFQAAIMAPTEILAEQHYLFTKRFAEPLGLKPVLLTGSARKSERNRMLQSVSEGEAHLVIGTHALIQKDVKFRKLGLAVIDEQHRFGVVQRGILKKKGFGAGEGVSPDILIMTATPIPRTLSMTVFGDLDVSIIDELPPGRKPVYTKVLREKERQKAYEAIQRELASGGQAYIVYPLVEESKELSLRDATNMRAHLEKDIFRDRRVGLLHGRLKAEEKESVMRDFKERKIDILVSTTVIEVGVDVPNASVMIIEHAERFGLAQLHQLRGRVGRGERKSFCLLIAGWTNSEDTYKRLKVMEETNDGFKIAEEDLKIRGPGDFLGTRQAGLPDFRTDGALSDLKLLKTAREEAIDYLKRNPGLKGPEGEVIRRVLKARWQDRLELAEIG
ncbi:MAG: ATP-dependent DNA helicase RecG [Deltaproteobacteria bacterium]|nr:ATP-dependent DNA helicase RecG [Deltaproteobacteria bacterium]MBZ0219019.1 ATP-dependent DNA helicase RecG [Deltaproteobacteria bacterium]